MTTPPRLKSPGGVGTRSGAQIPPFNGNPGDHLVIDSNGNLVWQSSGLPAGGNADEVLTKLSGNDFDVGWATGSGSSGELIGTGMPNGQVVAPVGTIYTDTDATNGAIRWIKQIGTGNQGWRVFWGDTGSRNLQPINDWSVMDFISIRRINDIVSMIICNLTGGPTVSSNTFLGPLPGFTPVAPTGPGVQASIFDEGAGSQSLFIVLRQDRTYRIEGRGIFSGIYSWVTDDPWPDPEPIFPNMLASLNPTSAQVGAMITANGNNFSVMQGNGNWMLYLQAISGGTGTSQYTWDDGSGSNTSIRWHVPNGATPGQYLFGVVDMSANNLPISNKLPFTVLP